MVDSFEVEESNFVLVAYSLSGNLAVTLLVSEQP